MHVDDLFFTGTSKFISSFVENFKKDFQIGSLDKDDIMFCGQRLVRQGDTVVVHQDWCIVDLVEGLTPKGRKTPRSLTRPDIQSTEVSLVS